MFLVLAVVKSVIYFSQDPSYCNLELGRSAVERGGPEPELRDLVGDREEREELAGAAENVAEAGLAEGDGLRGRQGPGLCPVQREPDGRSG